MVVDRISGPRFSDGNRDSSTRSDAVAQRRPIQRLIERPRGRVRITLAQKLEMLLANRDPDPAGENPTSYQTLSRISALSFHAATAAASHFALFRTHGLEM
jgi:hypothetical protein